MTAAGWTRRLPWVAVEVLESIYQHRLLSTVQVHAIHTPDASRRWTQRLLGELAGSGLLDVARGPRTVGVWFVTEAGAAAVEQVTSRTEPRRKLITPAQAAGQLQAHTLAVNEVGIAYLHAARQRGDEFGPLSWRHEIAHTIGTAPGRRGSTEQVIADALISYLAADADAVTQHQRFLELDRGTMPVEALLGKLRGYQRLRDYTPPPGGRHGGAPEPAWRTWYPSGLPAVQLVFAGKPRPQLERRAQLLLALRAADPALRGDRTLRVQLTLLEDLSRHGPFAPIWLRAEDPTARVDWLGKPKGARR
ncbi:replication-relaxation family protein [Conexibacter sp. CPCC 206217]|uniref:replication-relaxation family protein n=1 Tax=Conexibacter sp. CPCC 206217 TaxID=3064574 RepID=UPI0027225530|nr:replication-relaxation family protein [Conexibacter sp. CPCC 206217]MDO8213905.1 replication-relaxation family protein [Conexibacter sp. CPCC 206217]